MISIYLLCIVKQTKNINKLPEAGNKAPAFKGLNENGEPLSLADYKGKKLVLYFYPKDDTPGCTSQACNLRDHYKALIKKGYAVLGVSPDSTEKHKKFISKYNLPFSLIADTDKSICTLYGVWGEKSMYGKKYMGVHRTTFLIDEKGYIQEVVQKVDTKNHFEQIK